MNSTASLSGSYLHTYQTILQHPASHNLLWHDVHALLRQLGSVDEQPNGNLKVTRNGHNLVLSPARTKNVDVIDEIISLRHFLEQSETVKSGSKVEAEKWLVVIDHHEARIYRSVEPGSIPQQIRPHAPADFFRHAPHSRDFTRGQEKPDPNSFFEPVAGMLNCAGQILIIGTGTGMGSEMEQFTTWLIQHRPVLAKRIIGALTIDNHHLTEGQLLAKAREFYAQGLHIAL